MTVFGGKSVKNAPNMAFFGALRANRGTFCSFTAKVLKIKWVLEFMGLLLLPVRWVLAWKIVEFFWLLSFFGLEFFRKMFKKSLLCTIHIFQFYLKYVSGFRTLPQDPRCVHQDVSIRRQVSLHHFLTCRGGWQGLRIGIPVGQEISQPPAKVS